MRKLDLTGVRFGRLTALKDVGRSKNKQTIWECVCDCGNTTQALLVNLRAGRTKSCGCLSKELLERGNPTHGMGHTPEYGVYHAMIDRCTNKNIRNYRDYGGRGITVCGRWLESFENFYNDMGKRPSPNHSIERIDNSRGYSPDNCKWATPVEQARNRRVRKCNSSGVSGVYWHKHNERWVASIGINRKEITLGYFKDIEDAIKARKEAEQKYWKKSS